MQPGQSSSTNLSCTQQEGGREGGREGRRGKRDGEREGKEEEHVVYMVNIFEELLSSRGN